MQLFDIEVRTQNYLPYSKKLIIIDKCQYIDIEEIQDIYCAQLLRVNHLVLTLTLENDWHLLQIFNIALVDKRFRADITFKFFAKFNLSFVKGHP